MMLHTNNFRKISWSNLFAQLSEQIALAAAPLAAVLLLNATPSDTAWLQTSQTLPFLLLSIPAGLIADRISRRYLMIGSEMIRTITLTAVFLLLLSHSISLSMLAILGFFGAIGTVCYNVASPAYIPTIIPKQDLITANRWLELARSVAFAGGPAIGGAVVGYIGAPTAYVISISLSILAFMLLIALPKEIKFSKKKTSIFADLSEGGRFIFHHSLLRPILFTAIFFNTSWFIIQGIFVAYAITHLALSASQVGLTLGIYGIGMIVGALSIKYLSTTMSYGTMTLLGPTCGLIAAIIMLLTLWFTNIYLAELSYFLFGAGPTIWAITTMTLRQSVTPGEMMGRVSALISTATYGARPVGSAIAAVLAVNYGVRSCLWVAVAGFMVQFLILIFSRIPQLQYLPENPS